jgi:hypothetical protein
VHKKIAYRSGGYGESKVVATIESRSKKYEFRDVPQEEREIWIKIVGA